MSARKFEDVLAAFIKATNSSKKLAGECAQMAITHFHAHGDVSRCQQFFDAMPQNYLRKAAFVAWLVYHSPILLEDKKFSKDMARAEELGDAAWKIEEALATTFWDFQPEQPVVNYSLDDAQSQVIRLVKRLRSAKMQAGDPTAKAFVDRLETFAQNTPDAIRGENLVSLDGEELGDVEDDEGAVAA